MQLVTAFIQGEDLHQHRSSACVIIRKEALNQNALSSAHWIYANSPTPKCLERMLARRIQSSLDTEGALVPRYIPF